MTRVITTGSSLQRARYMLEIYVGAEAGALDALENGVAFY